jgi:hypothetical protein
LCFFDVQACSTKDAGALKIQYCVIIGKCRANFIAQKSSPASGLCASLLADFGHMFTAYPLSKYASAKNIKKTRNMNTTRGNGVSASGVW